MSWHIGETESEGLFWAAQFSVTFEDARVSSQARLLSGDMYPDTADLDEEWKSLTRARQLIYEREYDAVQLTTPVLLQSNIPYVRVMAGYYRGWARWCKGNDLAVTADDLEIDSTTPFGRAMAAQMLAWHRQRAFDFPGHMTALREATVEFLKCDPIPAYWLAQTLVPLLHTAFEMADRESFDLGRQAFHAVDWVDSLEHQKFDCLRAISRFNFVSGDTQEAIKNIAAAKCCTGVPLSCRSHAFLHSASYALEIGESLWAREQLEIAETLLRTERNGCPEIRTIVLSLALQYADINPNKAKSYLEEYHRFAADPNLSVAYDRRLDAVANISIGKIGLALDSDSAYSVKILERSYETVLQYGFHYRAAIAATEIAGAQTKRKNKAKWIELALRQIEYYGENSPLRKLLGRKLERIHLTESERRVCDLALAGKSNSEISEEVCLSPHRVANVLSTIYRKYGVRGRSELLARLH